MSRLTVATCQFPVSGDIARNLDHVLRQLDEAARRGADVAHFAECAMSGYAGSDLDDLESLDWDHLTTATSEVMAAASRHGIWVVLGSTHRLQSAKPHNSLYVIDPTGTIVDRYDKRFCAGGIDEQSGDLAHYTPGDHPCVVEIAGVRCGLLICHDYRYPELYREYKRLGVDVVFHSFHAANASNDKLARLQAETGEAFAALNPGRTFPAITMPATMVAAAAANHVWISCPNSSARHSAWGSFFVRADGVTIGRLARHRTQVLISTVDTEEKLYDSTVAWRDRAMEGWLHSGTIVTDPRSTVRTVL